MKLSPYLFILIIFSAFKSTCQEKNEYDTNLEIARSLYKEHQYLKSAQFYTKAFKANNNLGRADHRVEAARSWALAGNPDSVFYQLERSAKGNYSEYYRLSTDTAFFALHDDRRWNKVVTAVKTNDSRNVSLANTQYPNLNPQLVATLDTIYYDDQQLRWELTTIEKKYGRTSAQMKAHEQKMVQLDVVNQKKVAAILNQYGWPGKELAGERGNETIFLVIQHSHLEYQRQYLPEINKALASGKLRPSSYALLTDRMALAEGRLQTYGSQLSRNPISGKYFVQPMVDPANVDQRRKKVGLGPMQEYVNQWGITWSLEAYEKGLQE